MGADPAVDTAEHPATVRDRLRLGTGFPARERPPVVDHLSALDSRLRSHRIVALQVSVKDRAGRDQRVTLECWIAGRPRLVATCGEPELAAALVEVREHLRRQLDDAATRREPMHNRHLRETRVADGNARG